MLQFTHAGKMGDILYSLYFCRQLSRQYNWRRILFHIQIGKYITTQEAEFMRSLLESQTFIEKLTIGPEVPEDAINLNRFRNGPISFNGGDVRDYYYQFNSNTLPRHFEVENIKLKEPADKKYEGKIIVALSQKNINDNLNFKALQPYRECLVFFGSQNEYEAFCSKNFIIEKCELNFDSMLTIAKYMAGAKGFMGNQNTFFALAECMKVPRILLPAEWTKSIDGKLNPGVKNIVPFGGWTSVASVTEKMVSSVHALLDYVDIDNRKTKGKEKNDNTTKESYQSFE